MPEANATSPVYNGNLSESMSKANNRTFNFNMQDYLYGRKPDYYVYLYNVSEQSFDVFRPPLFANIRISGRKRGRDENGVDYPEYATAARLPSPLLAPQGSVDSDEMTTNLMDTRRVMMDICNPDNLSLDQNAVIAKPTNIGNNLSAKGVFWSLNNPPTETEIKQAVSRMENYYNKVLEKMKAMETSDPKGMLEMIGPEAHTAADYFGIETSWHGKRSRPMDCPNCSERVKAGIAFHRTEEGGICVLDWDRTVKAGAKTRAQAFEATEDPKYAPKGSAEIKAPVKSQTKTNVPTEDDLDVV